MRLQPGVKEEESKCNEGTEWAERPKGTLDSRSGGEHRHCEKTTGSVRRQQDGTTPGMDDARCDCREPSKLHAEQRRVEPVM